MSKPKPPLEMELERLAGKTPRTSSLWKTTNDDCTLPAGRTLGHCSPPPGPNRLRPPAPARSRGGGLPAMSRTGWVRGRRARARSRGRGPAPPARQCTGALVVSLVAESWKACGMQQRFETGSKIENKEEIRRNPLEISSN